MFLIKWDIFLNGTRYLVQVTEESNDENKMSNSPTHSKIHTLKKKNSSNPIFDRIYSTAVYM